MDFGALPPEVNSARMYSGAGAAPMISAAGAWSRIAAELSHMSVLYQRITTTLTCEEWQGSASQAMARAVEPLIEWLTTTATAAEHASSQAMSSAAAFEIAFAAIVPPEVIAANRAQLASLVATNVLGIHTAAIAATESSYAHMWAQDATVMYSYAAALQQSRTLQPVTIPPDVVNPMAGSPRSSSGLPSSLPSSEISQSATHSSDVLGTLSQFIQNQEKEGNFISITQTLLSQAGNIASWNMYAGISSDVMYAAAMSSASTAAATTAPIMSPTGILASSITSLSTPSSVTATMGHAESFAGLTVPKTWTMATDLPTVLTSSLEHDSTVMGSLHTVGATEMIPSGIPTNTSGHQGSFGFGTPRYGFKPTVMNRPVIGG